MCGNHPYEWYGWLSRTGLVLPVMLGPILVTIGCDDSEIQEYHVPKGVERITTTAPVDHDPLVPNKKDDSSEAARSGTSIESWKIPDGWKRVPQQRPMRVATFEILLENKTVEVAVTRFAGDVGGTLANVNRWRSQMGLSVIGEDDLPTVLTRFASSGFDGYAIRVRGQTQHMLAAGIHEASMNRTWFIRATTQPETADQVEDEIFGFARSIAGLTTRELK